MTITLRVDHEVTQTNYHTGYSKQETSTETLCDITEQHVSKGMLAAMLRQLADEVDPALTNREPF